MKIIKIKSPDDYIGAIREKTTYQEWRAFVVVFLYGLCLYIPMITERLNCSDGNICGIFYRAHSDYDWEDYAGRYLLKYVAHMKSMYVFSWMAVIVGLFCIAVGTIFIARMLRIHSTIGIIMTGLFCIVSPCFTEMFTYYFCADAYILCFTLVTGAVYLLHEKQTIGRFLFASFLMFISMALYQAFIFVAVVLFLFILIRDLLEGKKNHREIIIGLAYQSLSGIFAFILYIVVNKLLIKTGLIYEQGSRFILSEIFKPSVFLSKIGQAYRDFIAYYFQMDIINNVWKGRHLANGMILAIGIILLVTYMYRKRLSLPRIAGIGITLFCLPLAFMGIEFLYGVEIRILPASGLYYVGTLALWERERAQEKKNYRSILGWIFYAVSAWLIFIMSTYICIYQTCMKYYVDKTDSMAQRIITRIENTFPDADYGTPVFICGDVDEGYYPQDYNIKQASYILTGTQACEGMLIDNMQGYFSGWNKYIAGNFGVEYPMVWDKAWEIYDSDFYKEMPRFPAEGSVAKNEEGIIVVKIKE